MSSDEDVRRRVEEQYGAVHRDWRPSRVHLPRLSKSEGDRLSEKQIAARLLQLEQVQIELARQDPNAFLEFAFADPRGDPLRQAWFHEEWQRAMGEHQRVMIIAPRDCGKTTQIVARAIWELGHDPDLRIKIVCASDPRARERLYEIRQHLERNARVLAVFPHLTPKHRSQWTQHKLIVERASVSKDASVEALGITSSATGSRADLLIADDVVDQRNALAMPTLRKAVRRAWFSDLTQLLPPDGRALYICTLWHRDDLSHALMANPVYEVLRYDVGEHGEAIWPEIWSQERLLQRREEIGLTEFARAFRNVPQDESRAPIRPEWIVYVPEKDVNIDDDFLLWSYDLAVGQDDDHDYFAGVCFAVNERRKRVLVVDAYRARLSAPEQLDRIVEDSKRWRNAEVLVEKVAYQGSMLQFLREQERGLRVHGYTPRVNKRMRVDRTAPHLTRGQVRFMEYLDPGHPRNAGGGDLTGELLDFPFGRHDDLVDAFTQGVLWIAENFLYEEADEYNGPWVDLRFTGDGREDEDEYDDRDGYVDKDGNWQKYLF